MTMWGLPIHHGHARESGHPASCDRLKEKKRDSRFRGNDGAYDGGAMAMRSMVKRRVAPPGMGPRPL